MKSWKLFQSSAAVMLCLAVFSSVSVGQLCEQGGRKTVCKNNVCKVVESPVSKIPTQVESTQTVMNAPCSQVVLELSPLSGADESIELAADPNDVSEMSMGQIFARVTEATCRITVSGTCGSGTVVGRTDGGAALVLTNAHVAGTRKGRRVNVQRWAIDGSSEKGTGTIIASGYSRGLSVDFALLRCNPGFAANVQPIPLADRQPDASSGVTTYGCPRCEWPSLQTLQMTKTEGQILRWRPEAIGGRSGSSLIDYTASGPRVVGLLTWGGGGEGLGQSTPFILDAMRGRTPRSFESRPAHAREVSTLEDAEQTGKVRSTACVWPTEADMANIHTVPCKPNGEALAVNLMSYVQVSGETQSSTIDDILEDGPDAPADCPPSDEGGKPDEDGGPIDDIVEPDGDDDSGLFRDRPGNEDKPRWRPFGPLIEWLRSVSVRIVIALGAAAAGFIYGRFFKVSV